MNALESAAPRIPMRDFFRNPQETQHRVSPDGAYIAYLAPYESRMNVFVKRLGGGAATRVTGETARDIYGYFWKGDRILYARDFGGDENFHLVSVDLSGQDLKDLTPGDKVLAQIIDTLLDDDSHIIVAHNRRDPKMFDVFRTNVITGEEILIARNPGNSVGAAAEYWLDCAQRAAEFESAQPGRCHRVRYEDLVADPERVTAGVLSFLGAAPAPGLTEACFRAAHDPGPSDYKIWHTSGVRADLVGSGREHFASHARREGGGGADGAWACPGARHRSTSGAGRGAGLECRAGDGGCAVASCR